MNIVLELGDGEKIDSPEHVRKMLFWLNSFLKLKKGDKIIVGNEHLILLGFKGYPIGPYVQQFADVQRFVRENCPGVEVGVQSEAWYGNGEYFANLMAEFKRKDLAPDFVPINYYGPAPGLRERVALYQGILAKLGYNLPIEIAEIGVFVSDNPKGEKPAYPDQMIVDQDGQADYIVKALCLARCCRVRKVFWFNYQDDPENTTWPRYGLTKMDGSARKGLDAFKFANSLVDGTVNYGICEIKETSLYTRLILEKTDKSLVQICWNKSDYNLYLPSRGFTVRDASGKQVDLVSLPFAEEAGPFAVLPAGSKENGGPVRVFTN